MSAFAAAALAAMSGYSNSTEKEVKQEFKELKKKIVDIYDKKKPTTEEKVDNWLRIVQKYWKVVVGGIVGAIIVVYAIIRIASVGVG
jgi:type II secretory pathway component PulF